jgi:hypothetical protein
MPFDFSSKSAALAASLLALSACGGGGSDSPAQPPANRAPQVNAGTAQVVDEYQSVTLSGTASDADGDPLTVSWLQTAGPAVTIADTTSLTTTFVAPDVLTPVVSVLLTFELSASDGTRTSTDTVNIRVEDIGIGINSPPTADAGFDQGTIELNTVTLDGTNSADPDGETLTYSWTQTGGPDVPLANGNTAQPSFTAPDVAPGDVVPLTFELTVSDAEDSATDSVIVYVAETLPLVSVAGRLTYERPTFTANCRLDFAAGEVRPVRLATVWLLDASNNLLAETTTDLDGNYEFSSVNAFTQVRVRVRSELVQTSGPQTWEVYVRDNTSNTTQPFANRPLYEVQWPTFNTGNTNVTDADFTAETGWTGSGYDDQRRFAAPLAILDSLLDGILLVTDADPAVDMGRLDAFWSVNNTYSLTERFDDPGDGRIITAYYTEFPDGFTRSPSLFLRGDAIGRFPQSAINTDEFDEQVILHEWGHYFEDQLSRSDSRGGYHVIPGTVDALVAFGEGWGYGIGAIAANDPVGCDTKAPTAIGSRLDLENFNALSTEQGFFNEMSVATLLWDLFDTANDGVDNDSIGFIPIYDAMTEFQRDTEAFTTVFSFATGLRQYADPAKFAFIDAQLQRENVDTSQLDIWASGQVTAPAVWDDGRPVRDLLPLYTELIPGGPTRNLCVNVDERVDDAHNSPGLWRYLYFTLNAPQAMTLTIQANPVPPNLNPGTEQRDRSDPDVYLFSNGVYQGDFIGGLSGQADREVYDMGTLAPGTYALEFHDWRHVDFDTPEDPPAQHPSYPDRVCFDFTLN